MKLSSIFAADRPPAPSSVAALTQKHSAALEAVATARTAYHGTVYAAKDGDPATVKAKATAKAELDQAESRVAELQIEIDEERKNETATAKKAAKDERARRWDATLKHSKARRAAAAKVETTVAAMLAAWNELVESSEAMAAASPTPLVDFADMHGYIVQPKSLGIAVRLHMKRAGLSWAIDDNSATLGRAHELPTLSERINATDSNLQRLRADDGGV